MLSPGGFKSPFISMNSLEARFRLLASGGVFLRPREGVQYKRGLQSHQSERQTCDNCKAVCDPPLDLPAYSLSPGSSQATRNIYIQLPWQLIRDRHLWFVIQIPYPGRRSMSPIRNSQARVTVLRSGHHRLLRL